MTGLPPKLADLYVALHGRGEVAVSALYDVLGLDSAGEERRDQQQWLGPYITRLNRRLRSRGLVVRPGQRKGTYALVRQ